MAIEAKNIPYGTIAAYQTEVLQEDKMNYILSTVSEIMILFSTDMIVEYVNNAASIFHNQTSDNMIGKHVTELYESEIAPCGNNYYECPITKSSETGNPHTSKYNSPDGNIYLKTCYPVTDSEGRVIKLVQTFQNITKQVKAEEEKEIIKSKLIQSQKVESVGMLAGGIAHDFNNIMTIIIGFADLILMDERVDDKTLSYTNEIQKAGKRAASLTQQLLAFSRKQILKPELVNLNTLVVDTEKMLRVLLPENIILTSNLFQILNIVKVDPGQIVQVLMNLIINARDAMPDGGRITIETENKYLDKFFCKFHPDLAPGNYVMLMVSDTGCGMDPDTLVKAFEPFFTTKEVGKGTGLGLATVYGIVKQSGGYIYAHSELGSGTTFKIYLPKAQEADYKGNELTKNRKTLSGNGRILLVEDDKSLRKIISKMLSQFGYTVYKSGSGEEALQLYDKHNESGIDLLISDIIMPGMNGLELAETLLGVSPDMKILYISGYTDDIIASHGVLDEGVSFLAKPFSIFDIVSKVRNILDEQDGNKQAE